MHLLYVTAALPLTSGETFIAPEILELQRRGHRITLVPTRPRRAIVHGDANRLSDFTLAEPLMSLSILTNALAEIKRAPALAVKSALLVASSRGVLTFLKNVTVFPKGLWLARIAMQHGVDHIHAHWASTSATVAAIASLVSGIPWSFTAHRWDIPENNLLKKKAESAKFARTIDEQGARELAALIQPHQYKVNTIHMGVAFCHNESIRNGKERAVLQVLLAARFVEVKGHQYAIEAVAHLKNAGVDISLQCAGEGPWQAAVEKHAKSLGVSDRVQFLGLLDHELLLSRLREHHWDVALLPSIRTKISVEGIPVFLIEAMAAGVPVVSTNTGGIPELLHNGAGLLVPERDSVAIADALGRLANDGDLRRQLGEAGMQRVRTKFTIEYTVSALLDAISSRQ